MGRIGSRRPAGTTRSGRLAGPLTTLLAVLAIVAGCAGPAATVPPVPGSTPYPTASNAGGAGAPTIGAGPRVSAAPVASTATAPGPEPSAPSSGGPGAWSRLEPTALPQVATLVPTRAGPGGVARDTAFLLTSLDGRPAIALAGRLVSDPPISFAVAASGSAGATVRPTVALAPDTLYRISLRRTDGSVEASWAARTARPLEVTDSVPGNQATGVPLDAGIEFTFNQAGVTTATFASHFTIVPRTAGRFQVAGRSVVFVPDQPLSKGTLYTVTVSRGLPLTGTGEALAAPYVVRFETAAVRRSEVRVWLRDALVDATPRERAAFSVWTEVPEGSTEPKSVPATVHRLPGMTAAIAAWSAISKMPGLDDGRHNPCRLDDRAAERGQGLARDP